jgi:hypothetical protein
LQVLTQRIGAPESLAILLAAFILRAQRVGLVAEGVFEVGLNAAGTVPQARVARASSTHTGHAELQCAVAGFHIDCNMLLHLDERCKRRLAGSLLGGMRLH